VVAHSNNGSAVSVKSCRVNTKVNSGKWV